MEMFIHDSLHTAENTLFEMEQAASAMSPGGVMLVDDIEAHEGFATFARRHPGTRPSSARPMTGSGSSASPSTRAAAKVLVAPATVRWLSCVAAGHCIKPTG